MIHEAPLFVVGHERSGTTLLELMLRNHSQIDIPPESAFLSMLWRRLRSGVLKPDDEASVRAVVEDMADHRWIAEYWVAERGFTRAEVVARAMAGEHHPSELMRSILSLWSERMGATRWGEKAPRNYRFLDRIAEWFPDCRVIHMIRDPRDVAVSMLTGPMAARHDHGDAFEVGLRWRDAIRKGLAARGQLGPKRYLELRYEDLTADPEARIREVCDFIDEPFEPSMLDYHKSATDKMPSSAMDIHQRLKKKVDRKRVGRWKTEIPRRDVQIVEGLCAREMAEHGYEPSGWEAPAPLRLRIALESMRPRRLEKRYKPAKGRAEG